MRMLRGGGTSCAVGGAPEASIMRLLPEGVQKHRVGAPACNTEKWSHRHGGHAAATAKWWPQTTGNPADGDLDRF